MPRALFVCEAVPAHRLVLLPWVATFSQSSDRCRQFPLVVKMAAAKAAAEESFWMREPKPLEGCEVTEAGEAVVCCPFWHAFHGKHGGENCVELELRHGEWTVPIGGAVASDVHLRPSKPDRSSLIIRVPYLTNAAALPAGSVVCAKPNAHKVQTCDKGGAAAAST